MISLVVVMENLTLTRAFWCSDDHIKLDANGSVKIEINFVPFQLGHRQCSVLLINEDIGEFLYLIETETLLPLPCRVPYVPSAHSVRVSSSLAAHHGRGMYGGDDRVLYWKCDNGETFKENILIAKTNLAKENALGRLMLSKVTHSLSFSSSLKLYIFKILQLSLVKKTCLRRNYNAVN